jgi:hypothetical protein
MQKEGKSLRLTLRQHPKNSKATAPTVITALKGANAAPCVGENLSFREWVFFKPSLHMVYTF